MRLDKYLKVSRLIKRRTVANEACDAGRVLVNDKPAKASVQVKAGDTVEIQFGSKNVKVEVLDVKDTVRKEDAENLFRYSSLPCSHLDFSVIIHPISQCDLSLYLQAFCKRAVVLEHILSGNFHCFHRFFCLFYRFCNGFFLFALCNIFL